MSKTRWYDELAELLLKFKKTKEFSFENDCFKNDSNAVFGILRSSLLRRLYTYDELGCKRNVVQVNAIIKAKVY